jgi:membrane protease YdiL (CAAX protease family)
MKGFWYPQAFVWTLVVTLAVHLGAVLLLGAWPRAEFDIVLLGAMQVLVYAGLIRAFLAFQGDALGSDPLALGRARPGVILLALALGVVLQIPAGTLVELVDKVWRTTDAELAERLARISAHSLDRRILITAVVAGFGPLIEELFFRGALAAALLKNAPRIGTGICVAACFAVAHVDPRLWPALFVVGLALSYVRIASGSLWPGFALHAGFNLTTLATVFYERVPTGRPPPMPWVIVAVGWGMSALILVAIHKLVIHTPRGAEPS